MNHVADFLTPQNESCDFLNIIGTVFLAGIFLALRGFFQFRARLNRAVSAYRTLPHDDPETFLRVNAAPDRVMRPLAPIPGVLVTIGILGTFIGIGLAVSRAIPAFDSHSSRDVVQSSLRGLLTAVQFKFQTSAYGIFASLVFIALNSVVEWKTFGLLEANSSKLWPEYRRPSAVLAEALGRDLSEGLGRLDERLGAALSPFSSSAKSLSSASIALQESVAKLVTTTTHFGSTVDRSTSALVDSSQRLGGLGEDVERSLSAVSNILSDSAREQSTSFKANMDSFGRLISKAMSDSRDAQQVASTQFLATIREATSQQAADLRLALESVTTTLSNNLAHIADTQQKSAQTLQTTLMTLDRSLTTSLDAASRQQVQSAAHLQQSLSNSHANLTEAIIRMAANQQSAHDVLQQHQAEASTALLGLDRTLKEFQRKNERLLEIIERFQSATPSASPLPPPRRRVSDGVQGDDADSVI